MADEEKTNSQLVQAGRTMRYMVRSGTARACNKHPKKPLLCDQHEIWRPSGWCSCLLSPPSIRDCESPISPVVIASATAIFHRPRPTCGQCYGRACGSSCRAGLLACMKGSEKSAQCSEGAVLTVTSRSFKIGSLLR